MHGTRSKLAIAALAGVLAGGASQATASASAGARAHRASSTPSSSARASARRSLELTHVSHRLAVLQERAAQVRSSAEGDIARRMQIVERLREHLAQVQQGECPSEAACQRRAARVGMVEANIAFNEGLAKRRGEALQRALAKLALAEHAVQSRLASL